MPTPASTWRRMPRPGSVLSSFPSAPWFSSRWVERSPLRSTGWCSRDERANEAGRLSQRDSRRAQSLDPVDPGVVDDHLLAGVEDAVAPGFLLGDPGRAGEALEDAADVADPEQDDVAVGDLADP